MVIRSYTSSATASGRADEKEEAVNRYLQWAYEKLKEDEEYQKEITEAVIFGGWNTEKLKQILERVLLTTEKNND